jgi:hydrogenase maturation protein HypF
LKLPVEASRPLLACGAEQKSTFCVARGRSAWVSHHVGDLTNYETLRSFETGVEHFERLLEVDPEVVAYDLHPDYLSTGYAHGRDLEEVGVQHHHAHLAACLAEHGERGPAVGAIFDGTGYGTDGTIWGGELLVGGLGGFTRAAHLRPVRLPGGDRAVREPWRMACAWLAEAGVELRLPGVDGDRWDAVARLARSELAPVTTSVGRLFDAFGALCGLRHEVSYEGQAAVELEAVADRGERGAYPMSLEDARACVRAAARDVEGGIGAGTIAMRFHRGLARATVEACAAAAEAHSLGLVVLSGGVFQNLLLTTLVREQLEGRGLRVLVPRLLPPNDGGIAYGQAAIAAAREA